MYRSDRQQSDEEYRQTVLQRRQRRIDAKRDTPERRRNKLLQSFQRRNVSMVSSSTKGSTMAGRDLLGRGCLLSGEIS